jgi:hypothetical protein
MKYLALLALVIAIGLGTTAHVSAEHTTLKQQILPLDCVFETVNDGLGTINYLTPAECGVLIPPVEEPEQPTPTTDPIVIPKTRVTSRTPLFGSSSEPLPDTTVPHTENGGKNDPSRHLLLNNIRDALSAHGYVVRVKTGDVLFYRPVDSPQIAVRGIVVGSIDGRDKTVRLAVSNLNLSLLLLTGEIRTFDRLKNNEPAISVKLEKFNSKDAILRIRLLRESPVAHRQPGALPQLAAIVALLGAAAFIRLWPHWSNYKKPSA